MYIRHGKNDKIKDNICIVNLAEAFRSIWTSSRDCFLKTYFFSYIHNKYAKNAKNVKKCTNVFARI